jgi:hypothetical protein
MGHVSKPRRKTCRCTAPLSMDGTCPYKCPPVVRHVVNNRTGRRQVKYSEAAGK